MSGANFILAINLFVAGLLAAAFMTVAAYDTRRVAARWLALGYAVGMVYFVVEFSIPAFNYATPPVVAAFAVFLAATLIFNVGLANKYGIKPPWRFMVAFLLLTSVIVYFVQDLPRNSFPRMAAYQFPYAAAQLIGLWIVWSSRQRREKLDIILMAVLAASALQFASKPLIAHALGGWGANPQAYLQTNYAMVSQSIGTVFAIAIALLLLVILVRDVLAEATSKSETDTLSGLLNRGGFERHAETALRDGARQGLPVSLVIADLDHFKLVNDNFGHACGDRVIETFSGFLRDAAGQSHLAARLGGEEFAVMLPGTNLAAARLFAEGARSAFGALPIKGLPLSYRCTASFGVAELRSGETLSELVRRADEALYGAKKGGRDQVRVASGPIALVGKPNGKPLGNGFNGRD